MMRGYHGHQRHDSLSDAVFSEDEFYQQDFYSPNQQDFYSPNQQDFYSQNNYNYSVTNSTTSLQDVFYSSQSTVREVVSPTVSNYSTYSHEVKYIFDPNFGNMQQRSRSHSNIKLSSTPAHVMDSPDMGGNSVEDDYSHIQHPNTGRKPAVQRKSSNSSQLSYRSQSNLTKDQGQGHAKNPPPPPPRTSSSTSSQNSHQGDATLSPRKPGLSHSMSASYSSYYYPQNQGRRKTWSPEELFGVGSTPVIARRNQRLRAYSNEQLGDAAPMDPRERSLTMDTRTFGMDSRSVVMDHRLVAMDTRPVAMDTRLVSGDTRPVSMDAKPVAMDARPIAMDTRQDGREQEPIYEELEAGPPKLTPVSGMLNRSPGRGIVKPIAFKPVMMTQRPATTPSKPYGDHPRKYSNNDDGYGSQDYGQMGHNVSNLSHGSGFSHVDFDRSASFSSDCNRTSDRSDSVAASHTTRLSTNQIDGYVQTPSPSDSGVGELEAILKEKDAEINTLRDVMDKNERAIFQVYEEKRNGWVREIQVIRDEYESKLKQIQRKQYKSEQVLNLQVFKLQQDKKAMKEEYDKLYAEKEDLVLKCEAFAEETNRLQAQMDDATWQGRRPSNNDASGLQKQVDRLTGQLKEKSEEVLKLQTSMSDLKSKLDISNANLESHNLHQETSSESLHRINYSGSNMEPDIPLCHCEKQIQTDFLKLRSPERETLKPSLICERDRELTVLREEIDKLRLEMLVSKEEHDKEKEQWLEEKNKVIMYQKQLQLNYVQMFRKNKVLEAEVEQLTLELESRDMKLMALNGEESVC
ncbi:leucine zipper putative tumor suppressor 2 homolog [Dreissena polymorpha]|uniref:Uncharacterized protein n=1 Tax=Dreissena polymorpha TaxID=45954 RepID=A0A9D4EXJ8_DREPO|nr:leucine zipper putative tumor suppressor 2 homolog [Dreissena polymorpha]XP_052227717.1 leucine zipper putative tumor suppressor 2 homolog [Dreissena polymorpha]XP_052227718.1 leucine zipper putative tumor suppressor 2 homolog [Dreissena polymorpha]XP_052227719.1 leucine zipper putative tumor suppressor 2 homolog [Dreissena polymorpha]XP_052227720.1 leucine zipper putative tumor suppressor 2 homolog [Dreissena polymorpha]XP_052227721.1 leucine zipper putative tumor suppressor 2 homolog [Dre